MKIHYLWHSEFIVEMKWNKETKKILVDSWLSNYALWDMMMRNPKIKLDYDNLDIDAIFISHSHCDHLDPYTLVEIYEKIKPRPTLLIPETLLFLVPIFKKYLPKQKIEILKNKQVFDLDWVSIKWIIFENDYLTNEDDVMTLAIYNEKDLVYSDIDTLPPENEDSTNELYELFTTHNFENALYLSTRNELPWNFRIIQAENSEKRIQIKKEYEELRASEIEYNYFRFEEDLAWVWDIQELPNFMKWLIGQWIIHPNPEFLKLRTLTLKQWAKLEKQIAKSYSRNFPIEWFEPWSCYHIKDRQFNNNWLSKYISEIDYQNPKLDINTQIFKEDKAWPLDDRKWNHKAQEQKILTMLNQKFLPYRMANSQDNLKNAILNSKNHRYVVKIYYWNLWEFFERNYYFDFGSFEFREEKWKHEDYNEDYWANDLEDFLDWKQELYSNFWHKLNPKKAYRVWTMLWANFINNDIVYKKFDFHFKRAVVWKTIDEYVEKIIDKKMN